MKHSTDKKEVIPSLEDLVVGEGKRSMLRTGIVLLVLVAILFICIVGYAMHKRQQSHIAIVCNQVIIEQGRTLNDSGNVTAFKQLAGTIRQKDNYTKDPNCLYILAEYQITTGDLPAAKAAIDHLRTTYGSGYVFDRSLDSGQASIANLLQQFKVVQNAQNNSKGRIDPAI